MNELGRLPKTLMVSGEDYPIRTDFWDILRVFKAFNDPELEPWEQWIVAIFNIFSDFDCCDDVYEAAENGFDINEAIQQINWFISAGQPKQEIVEKPVYDWQKDEQMIFSAVNAVAGMEVRELEHCHWWTFLGWFNEQKGNSSFGFVVSIRNKLNKRKKLEKHEKEFLSHNKELVKLEKPKSKKEQEQEDAYNALLNEVLG